MPGFLIGPLTGFTDRSKGKGVVSSSWLAQVGKSAAQAAGGGVVAAGFGLSISPGSINNDNVLAVWTIPSNLFDIAGRSLQFWLTGSVANNTHSKELKLWVAPTTAVVGSAITGGTLVADSGAYTTTGAAGWSMGVQIAKYGAAGSNTQRAYHQSTQIGNTVSALLPQTSLTLTEAASFTVALTGDAVTATTDIVFDAYEIYASN